MSNKLERIELGEYIAADAHICRGQPTFKGTRLLVRFVLEYFLDGFDIEEISQKWAEHIPREAVMEAVQLALRAIEECFSVPPAKIDLEKLFSEEEAGKPILTAPQKKVTRFATGGES
ncbi:MAG: DUF433 domain-containing protein [Candidatus Poribacteria bacterium]